MTKSASNPTVDEQLREQLHDPIRKLSIQLTASTSVTGKVPEKLYEYEYELENTIVNLITRERIAAQTELLDELEKDVSTEVATAPLNDEFIVARAIDNFIAAHRTKLTGEDKDNE